MFYDERIEKARGNIARNSIVISVIISALIGAIRLTNVLKNSDDNKYLFLVVLEAVIVSVGLITLFIGFIRSKLSLKDERVVAEQASFYNKASMLLIKSVAFAFAILLPVVLYIGYPHNFADTRFDSILYVLFFIVGIYVIYSFRRNDIYFNYSFMEEEHYYKCVFRNIKKLALYMLLLFAISVILLILIVAFRAIEQAALLNCFIQIIAVYVFTLIELSLLYLLYSFLEKTSYNSNCPISKSAVISMGIAIFIYAVYTFITLFANSASDTQVGAIQLITSVSYLKTYIDLAILIFLTYFSYEYQKQTHNRLLSAACVTILLSEAVAMLLGMITGCVTNLLLPGIIKDDTYFIINTIAAVKTVIGDISCFADIVGFSLIIIALIKDKAIKKANFAVIICFAALAGIEIFLRTQVGYIEVNIYHALAEIAVLLYFGVIVKYIGRKKEKESC